MPVTNYMILQKLAEVNKKTRSLPTSSSSQKVNFLDEEGTVSLFVEKIVKVNGDTVISEKNKKARLYNPMPCLFWKCTVTPDTNGVATLSKPLEALFIDDGSNVYCLGVMGSSDEFEVRFHVGDNEIRLNKNFLNIKAKTITQNGLEVKQ